MKRQSGQHEDGSILMMGLITITILTLICATSLYVTSQDANATTQTTSWQQAMAGAEAAVDQAMNGLNTGTWTGWSSQPPAPGNSLPTTQPTPSGTPAIGAPDSTHYNYYSSSFPLQGEASNSVSMWVTVDNGSLAPTSSGLVNGGAQAYRIRATATVEAPGPKRVSNSRLDNDLRHISLLFDRLTGTTNAGSHGQAARRIELVAVPVAQSIWARAISTRNGIQMSGGAWVDSFNSSNPSESTNHLYDPLKRQDHGDIGTTNNDTADLRNTYVYGSIQYSGPAIKDTTNVQGGISTPFNVPLPSTVDPNVSGAQNWAQTDNLPQYTSSQQATLPTFQTVGGVPANYTSYTGGGSPPTTTPANTFTASGSASSPTLIKVTGDFTVPGGRSFRLVPSNGSSGPTYVIIWVTGKFTSSGSGFITQNANVKATWVVDNNITVSGNSYNNQSGYAAYASFVGVGSNHYTVTDSGSATFIGTINAPGYDVTISGTGAYSGSVIGNTITLSGSGGFHYDEDLKGGYSVANFTYASWFEDNSDPKRGMTF